MLSNERSEEAKIQRELDEKVADIHRNFSMRNIGAGEGIRRLNDAQDEATLKRKKLHMAQSTYGGGGGGGGGQSSITGSWATSSHPMSGRIMSQGLYGAPRDINKEPIEVKMKTKEETTVSEAKKILARVLTTNIVPFLWGPPGTGKCLQRGTLVLTHDGINKPVENIQKGDKLMGVNSKPRLVLSTTSGKDMLYKIQPNKGASFTVNKEHVLSLKRSFHWNRHHSKLKGGTVINISVKDYLKKSNTFKHQYKLYRVGVDFPHRDSLELHPYFLGIWLGDGASHRPTITTGDKEIFNFLKRFTRNEGLKLRVYSKDGTSAKNCAITTGERGKQINRKRNRILESLRKLDLIKNKHIPVKYKVNSRKVRLEVLAGLIDTDGYKTTTGYSIAMVNKKLINDIAFLARSLGFAAYIKKYIAKIKSINYETKAYKLTISGDCSSIPVKIKNKKQRIRKQEKDVLVTGFKIEKIGNGEYYGFELDGDGLFLLGDFTVTHNSTLVRQICKEKNWKLIDLRLSLLNPVDLRGLPVVRKADKMVDWFPPSFLPNGHTKEKGILFLDEINLAPLSVQSAAYQLILDKQVGEYRFPDHWKIIAAGNREIDRANVYKLSAPLANRFMHITIMPDFEEWRQWAQSEGNIRKDILNFLILRPQLLFKMPTDSQKAFPSPRCVDPESLVIMLDGSKKPIKNISIGDKILGYRNGSFVESKVLNKFKKFTRNGFEIATNSNHLNCSPEHRFLTEKGYLQAKELNDKMPVYVYRESNAKKERVVKKTQPFRNTKSISSRADRWGGKFLFSTQKTMGKGIFRTTMRSAWMLFIIQRLYERFGIQYSSQQKKYTKRIKTGFEEMARQICSKNLWIWNVLFNRRAFALLSHQKTNSLTYETVYHGTAQSEVWSTAQDNSSDEKITQPNQANQLQKEKRIISIRKRNYQKVFYDLTTSTDNYIANGFIVHNSWEFLSQLMNAYGYDGKHKPTEDLSRTIIGTIGSNIAKEFIKFLEDFTLAKVSEAVDEFKKTGKLDLPTGKKISIRMAIITAIHQQFIEQKLTKSRHDEFLNKLSSEEREAIKEYDEKEKPKVLGGK